MATWISLPVAMQRLHVTAAQATTQLPETLRNIVGAFQMVSTLQRLQHAPCMDRQATAPEPEASHVHTGDGLQGCRAPHARPKGCYGVQVPDQRARYEQLLYMGKKLPPMPAEEHTLENKVQGCVSQVNFT